MFKHAQHVVAILSNYNILEEKSPFIT